MLHSNEPATGHCSAVPGFHHGALTTNSSGDISASQFQSHQIQSIERVLHEVSTPTDADQTLKTIVYHFRESGLRRKQSALV